MNLQRDRHGGGTRNAWQAEDATLRGGVAAVGSDSAGALRVAAGATCSITTIGSFCVAGTAGSGLAGTTREWVDPAASSRDPHPLKLEADRHIPILRRGRTGGLPQVRNQTETGCADFVRKKIFIGDRARRFTIGPSASQPFF